MDLALYIMLFPQLIAGPIVRYSDVQKEIGCRRTCVMDVYEGFFRFMVGFSKKILLANTVGKAADLAFVLEGGRGLLYAWIGLLCYCLQIYLDFLAYSDMAAGLGRIFGFRFPENFNHPYTSKSIREFWRRWHISLSMWFRDYLYIPFERLHLKMEAHRLGILVDMMVLVVFFLAICEMMASGYNPFIYFRF